MRTELLIGHALNPILAYKSTLQFVVKSSKSDDLDQTLFLRALVLQAIKPCKT